VQPFANACGKAFVALAIRGAKIPLIASFTVEDARCPRTYLMIGQCIPGADRELAEPIVDAQLRSGREMLTDDLGSSARASQWACDDPGGCGIG